MPKFEVIFYEEENGECPVEEFLAELSIKMRAKLREPYSKYLEDGIFEIRCKVGNNITRVLYFFYYEGKIVLTNGFVKKSQKTPQREIKLAKARRADFLERAGKDEDVK